jgi:hypothetical protein
MSRIPLVIAGAIAVAASAGVALAVGGSMGAETMDGSNSKELSLVQGVVEKKNVVYKMNARSGSRQNGTVTLSPKGSSTDVVIKLNNEPASALEPAFIHAGACGTPGPVKYPLTEVVKGVSHSIVSVTTGALEAGTFSVRVHKSTAQLQVNVSCGNLN